MNRRLTSERKSGKSPNSGFRDSLQARWNRRPIVLATTKGSVGSHEAKPAVFLAAIDIMLSCSARKSRRSLFKADWGCTSEEMIVQVHEHPHDASRSGREHTSRRGLRNPGSCHVLLGWGQEERRGVKRATAKRPTPIEFGSELLDSAVHTKHSRADIGSETRIGFRCSTRRIPS